MGIDEAITAIAEITVTPYTAGRQDNSDYPLNIQISTSVSIGCTQPQRQAVLVSLSTG